MSVNYATDSQTPLPATVVQHIDLSKDDTEHVLRADFLTSQLDGSQPFVERQWVSIKCDLSAIIPAELVIRRRFVGRSSDSAPFVETVLARGMECCALIKGDRDSTLIMVSAITAETAREVLASIVARTPVLEEVTTEDVHILFWARTDTGGARGTGQRISAPAWESIARNYPGRVSRALTELTGLNRPIDRGKLILLHGEAGTGKTTALRALAREWHGWCDIHYVTDPETLLADPNYMMDVLWRPPIRSARNEVKRWQLIVAEDSDEYLRASARRHAGAALGRLLNVSDGIFGQGSDTLIVLTTNERIDRLHPALTRPGRCLAEIAFCRFTVAEASSWLHPDVAAPTEPLTLAELFERNGTNQRITSGSAEELESIGAYL